MNLKNTAVTIVTRAGDFKFLKYELFVLSWEYDLKYPGLNHFPEFFTLILPQP